MGRVYGAVLAHDITKVVFTPTNQTWVPLTGITTHIDLNAPRLTFNGPAWRLWRHTFHHANGRLTIMAGKGRYADYKFTNLDHSIRQTYPFKYFWFNAIVPCALCITSDEKVVLGMRQAKIGGDPNTHAPSTWDIPGGHPPEGLEPNLHGFEAALAHIVRKEIMCGIEVARPFLLVEEVPTHGFNLIYSVRIREKASALPEEATDQHSFFTTLSIDPGRIRSFFREEWKKMGPPTYSALLYLGRQAFGESWFEEIINMTAH